MMHSLNSIIGSQHMGLPAGNRGHSRTAFTRNVFLLAVVICTLFAGPAQQDADAQIFCDSADPAYGTCFLQTEPFDGDIPFSTTVNVITGDLFVADYLSGVFYRYNASELSAPPETLTAPKGPATYLGLAWSGFDNNLYWIVNDQGALLLVVSSLGGNLISETPLTVPSGATSLSGLAWLPNTNTFWTNDFENDTYLEMATDGSFTGNSFPNPALGGTSAGAFGLGLAVVQDLVSFEFYLDIPIGPPAANRTSTVERVDTGGNIQGLSFPLASVNNLSGWVTGIAWVPEGSAPGTPSHFILDQTNKLIVEVPVPNPAAPSISVLNCTANNSNDVTLDWVNPLAYDQIEVYRNGALVSTLGPGGDTFLDEDLDPGTYLYEVVPFPATSTTGLPPASCEIVVGLGRFLGVVEHSGAAPGGADVVSATDQLVVADSSGLAAWFYQLDLTPLNTSIPGPYSSAQNLAGIAANPDDTLTWLTEEGDLRITDLNGTETAAFNLALAPGDLLSGLTWSTTLGGWLTVNVITQQILNIDPDGTFEILSAQIPSGPSPTAFFGGIAVRAGSTNVFDIAFGSLANNGVARVERFVGSTPVGLGFDLAPSVNSGDIHGLAAAAEGPFGFPVTYVVGRDAGTVTMLSANLSGTGSDFIRGEAVPDGSLNLLDVTQMLIKLFDQGQEQSLCLDSLDANDDGSFDISDPIFMLGYLFEGGSALADPVGVCGEDPTLDNLTCQEFPGC
ncbi:MAG: hypothetical protein CBC13_06700 [Planctomycetia bacterium TMED53]|nr:MAG: hypothetical protein CBC13_06700 [Planctomycetia bacterium TMED53]